MNNRNLNTKDSDSIDILRIISERKGLIFLSLILALAGAYITTTVFITPTYQAIVKVFVKQEKLNPSNMLPIYEHGDTFIKSQAEVISSKPIIKEALKSLNESPIYKDNDKIASLDVNLLQESIEVEVLRGTNVLELKVEIEDKVLIAPLTNEIARAYTNYCAQNKEKIVKGALDNIDNQVEFVKKQLDKEEQSLEKYLLKEEIGVLPESEIGIDFKRFAYFDLEVVKVAAELESVNTKLMQFDKAIKASQPEDLILPFLVDNPVLRDFNNKIRLAEIAISDLLVNYTLDHPEVVSTQLAIQEFKNGLKSERKKIITAERESIKMEKSRLESKMEILFKEKEIQSKKLQNLLKKQPKLSSLLSRVKSKRSMYEDLLTQQSELKTFSERTKMLSDIVIFEPAEAPIDPISPNLLLNLFFGALCGLIIGSVIVIMKPVSEKEDGVSEEEDAGSERKKYDQIAERRGSQRSKTSNKVTYTVIGEEDKKYTCWTKDIGRSGMKIISEEALKKNSILEFKIHRDKVEPVKGNGVIVWSSAVSEKIKDAGYVSGVKFYDVELDIKNKLS